LQVGAMPCRDPSVQPPLEALLESGNTHRPRVLPQAYAWEDGTTLGRCVFLISSNPWKAGPGRLEPSRLVKPFDHQDSSWSNAISRSTSSHGSSRPCLTTYNPRLSSPHGGVRGFVAFDIGRLRDQIHTAQGSQVNHARQVGVLIKGSNFTVCPL
jgi:hypothetical protein